MVGGSTPARRTPACLARGLRVTFSDVDQTALTFAANNARLNGYPDGFRTLPLDFRCPPDGVKYPVVIGSDTTIVNSYVGPFTSIAAGCEIRDSELDQSVVLEGSRIVGVSPITDSLIGRNVEVLRTRQRPRALRLLVGDHSTIELE